MKYTVFILVTGIFLLSILLNFLISKEKTCPTLPQHTSYDIVLECQKLSAVANDDWGYQSCIDALEESLEGEVKFL